jgi:hypothetical protein
MRTKENVEHQSSRLPSTGCIVTNEGNDFSSFPDLVVIFLEVRKHLHAKIIV